MSEQARLFLALWPDSAIRHDLAAWRDAWHWPRGASPVHDDKLHLTLHFIGAVARERIGALREALRVPMAPITLAFGTPELWQRGVAVLAPLATSSALLDLHAALAQRLQQAGLEVEQRPYRPHVTMARRANGAAMPAAGPAISWQASGYALMESSGGRYTVLEQYRA